MLRQPHHVPYLQVTHPVCDMFYDAISPRTPKAPDSEVHPALKCIQLSRSTTKKCIEPASIRFIPIEHVLINLSFLIKQSISSFTLPHIPPP